MTREEGGFFTRLAEGLADSGVASLRYDLRGHGESEGRPEESSLAAHLNDIRVAIAHLCLETDVSAIHLIGTSFGGGLAAYYAAKRPSELERLVLLNPQLDYKDRYIDQKPHWDGDHLTEEAAALLKKQRYLEHRYPVLHSRAFLNEVFWIRPDQAVAEIVSPTLIVQGTADTFVPVESARKAAEHLRVEHRLVEIEGAQHGFAVHDDPLYLNPQSQKWQAFVIESVRGWLAN